MGEPSTPGLCEAAAPLATGVREAAGPEFEALVRLIGASFSPDEFRLWVCCLRGGGPKLEHFLPGASSEPMALFFAAAKLLIRRGFVDAEFFDALARHVPRRRVEVTAVRRAFGLAETGESSGICENTKFPTWAVVLASLALATICAIAWTVQAPPASVFLPEITDPWTPQASFPASVRPFAAPSLAASTLAETTKPPSPAIKPIDLGPRADPVTSVETPAPDGGALLRDRLGEIARACVTGDDALTLTLSEPSGEGALVVSPARVSQQVQQACIHDRIAADPKPLRAALRSAGWSIVEAKFTARSATTHVLLTL